MCKSEYGVSDSLANYLTMALDVTVGDFVKFMETQFRPGEYRALLDGLEVELDRVMTDGNFTDVLELFRAIAIRCQVGSD